MPHPDHAEVARTALRALAAEVEAAETLHEAAGLTTGFFAASDSVANAFTSVLWAVAHHFEARIRAYDDADAAYAQWHRLAEIAEAHNDLTDGLASTLKVFQLLEPGQHDHGLTARRGQALAVSPARIARQPGPTSATPEDPKGTTGTPPQPHRNPPRSR